MRICLTILSIREKWDRNFLLLRKESKNRQIIHWNLHLQSFWLRRSPPSCLTTTWWTSLAKLMIRTTLYRTSISYHLCNNNRNCVIKIYLPSLTDSPITELSAATLVFRTTITIICRSNHRSSLHFPNNRCSTTRVVHLLGLLSTLPLTTTTIMFLISAWQLEHRRERRAGILKLTMPSTDEEQLEEVQI